MTEGGPLLLSIPTALGGLALFMLAMAMMTDGLKVAAGEALRGLLERWAATPVRGILIGAAITAVVQSSSAVTVATIGFVNAGILGIKQALFVTFGANIGTTMTGWLVSIVGFDLKIEAFALPILAIGVFLQFTSSGKRMAGLGTALAGFGLFFLGLSILKTAFGDFAMQSSFVVPTTGGWFAVLLAAAGGLALTVLTQSSSAAIAIVLTAVTAGVVDIAVGAGAVIGANLGTTSTALLAALNATANAKRVATGHIAFNLSTGLVALAILPLLLWLTDLLQPGDGLEQNPAVALALFHTIFNCLGVLLMTPATPLLTRLLMARFRSKEEDQSHPQYLDRTIATPALAVSALYRELDRMVDFTTELIRKALSARHDNQRALSRNAEALGQLGQAIDHFVTELRMEHLPRDIAEEISAILRINRYLDEAAQLAPKTVPLGLEAAAKPDAPSGQGAGRLLAHAGDCLERVVQAAADIEPPEIFEETLAQFNRHYNDEKHSLLVAAAEHPKLVAPIGNLLDSASDLRRMIEQVTKAVRMLTMVKTTPASLTNQSSVVTEELPVNPVGGNTEIAGNEIGPSRSPPD